MSICKKIFASVFVVMAIMLMRTTAFAYTGAGTEEDPYLVYTFDDLKTCMGKGGYIELQNDIYQTHTERDPA